MQHKLERILTIFVGALFALALSLVLTPAMARDQLHAQTQETEGAFTWYLSNPEFVKRGQVLRSAKGTLVTGFTISASATGPEGAPVKDGVFRLDYEVFSPNRPMPGQKPGFWYVRGSWSITDERASQEAVRIRHNPNTLKGTLGAELPFNPLAEAGMVNAQLRVPLSPQGGKVLQGEGSFTGDEMFSGEMTLLLKQRQQSR